MPVTRLCQFPTNRAAHLKLQQLYLYYLIAAAAVSQERNLVDTFHALEIICREDGKALVVLP